MYRDHQANCIYVGKEFGKYADLIKYVVEKEEDPEIKEPDELGTNEAKDKMKWFK